jgi:hypothetical protein
MNIVPPILPKAPTNGPHKGMSFMHDGMDPNLIEDPVAREAYLKAGAENDSNQVLDVLQRDTLPQINRTMTFTFLEYSKKVVASHRNARKQVDDLASIAHLTEQERQQLQYR